MVERVATRNRSVKERQQKRSESLESSDLRFAQVHHLLPVPADASYPVPSPLFSGQDSRPLGKRLTLPQTLVVAERQSSLFPQDERKRGARAVHAFGFKHRTRDSGIVFRVHVYICLISPAPGTWTSIENYYKSLQCQCGAVAMAPPRGTAVTDLFVSFFFRCIEVRCL